MRTFIDQCDFYNSRISLLLFGLHSSFFVVTASNFVGMPLLGLYPNPNSYARLENVLCQGIEQLMLQTSTAEVPSQSSRLARERSKCCSESRGLGVPRDHPPLWKMDAHHLLREGMRLHLIAFLSPPPAQLVNVTMADSVSSITLIYIVGQRDLAVSGLTSVLVTGMLVHTGASRCALWVPGLQVHQLRGGRTDRAPPMFGRRHAKSLVLPPARRTPFCLCQISWARPSCVHSLHGMQALTVVQSVAEVGFINVCAAGRGRQWAYD